MKALLSIFRKPSDFDRFAASVRCMTRTELVVLTRSLARNEKAHPGMLRMAEKRLARMDGFRGA